MVGDIVIFIGACLGVPVGIFLARLGLHRRTIGLGLCGTAIVVFSLITMILVWSGLGA